jgi:hypothetical protein
MVEHMKLRLATILPKRGTEANGRAYCRAIGADPDERIIYWQRHGDDGHVPYGMSRWQAYVNADPVSADVRG